MNDIDDIRRANLQVLQNEAGGPAEAAALLLMSPSQFTNLRKGAKDSKSGKPRGMRKDTARKIERLAGKPSGWLDTDHGSVTASVRVREEAPDWRAWLDFSRASIATRAAIELLLLPSRERARAIKHCPGLVAAVELIETYAPEVIDARKSPEAIAS